MDSSLLFPCCVTNTGTEPVVFILECDEEVLSPQNSTPRTQGAHAPVRLQSDTLTDTLIRTLTQSLAPFLTDTHMHIHIRTHKHNAPRTTDRRYVARTGLSKVENASQNIVRDGGWPVTKYEQFRRKSFVDRFICNAVQTRLFTPYCSNLPFRAPQIYVGHNSVFICGCVVVFWWTEKRRC